MDDAAGRAGPGTASCRSHKIRAETERRLEAGERNLYF
jgi:hypothetical protein